MAKAKSNVQVEKLNTSISLEETISQLEKSFGKNFITSGEAIADSKPIIIPVSPNVDIGLGGGIPEGSWVSISGPEKIGKSCSALSFAAECQKPEYGSRPIFYFDIEHRLKSRDINGIKGLIKTSPHFNVIRSQKGNIYSNKDYLTMAQQFITDVPGCVCIFDSLSAMCNSKVQEEGIGTSDYGSGNKLVAQFVDINESIVPINKCIMIGIIHFYANSGGGPMASATKEKVATRWKYQSDVALVGKWSEPWRTGKDDSSKQIGQIVHWTVKHSAIGPPGAKIDSYIRYGTGIDKVYEMMLTAQDVGLISGTTWYTLTFLNNYPDVCKELGYAEGEEIKLQGNEKVYRFINDNVKVSEILNRELKSILG